MRNDEEIEVKVKNHPFRVKETERICISCKYYRAKRWNLFAWIDRIFRLGDQYHRCEYDGISTHTNRITGKVTVTITTKSCTEGRRVHECNSYSASSWEPSSKWLNDKRNAFKILKGVE